MKAKVKTWLTNLENGNIKSKTERILDAIVRSKTVGIDTDDLRECLNISHQTVTAVLSALQDEGLVKVVNETQKGNSWYSIWVFVDLPQERQWLQYERERDKVITWLKRGLVEYEGWCTDEVKGMLKRNLFAIEEGVKEPVQLKLF
jgi:transcription initiation factor IIE alpha subunit